MKTSRSDLAVKTIGIVLGAALGIGGAAIIGQTTSDHTSDRVASDKCWAQGGEYRNGTCEKPEDKMSPEGKVCNALAGSYMVQEGSKTKCYSFRGEELKMPDVKDKEVIVMDDGTVTIRDKRK